MTISALSRALGGVALATLALAAHAAPTVIYDSLGPTVFNLPSLGYQATSTSEFGDRIGFAAGSRALDSVTVRMSSWALASSYSGNPLYGNAAGYNQQLTFNIYGTGVGDAPGALIGSSTIGSLVPWRPEADPTCPGGTAWRASDGACYNGMAFDVVFDFSSLGLVLPDEVVFGIAFDTQSYGANPTGVDGPYNSLNVGLSAAATVGTDVNSDGVFWNTAQQGFLTTGTAGKFGQDTDWSGFVPAVQFNVNVVPEPGSLALVALALVGLGGAMRKRRV